MTVLDVAPTDCAKPPIAAARAEARILARRFALRTFDVVGSVVGLVVFAPLMVGVAIAVRVADPGRVLFRQRRVGRGGRVFRIAKFRTMAPDAEAQLRSDPALRAAYVANGYKLPEGQDPRISRIGRLLRRLSLDEVPQLWNVLRGDMSLVGPRPIVEPELEVYEAAGAADLYLALRPGVTGLWQVSGRSRLDADDRIALDRRWAENPTVGTYLAVLLRTPLAVLSRDGAH